MSVRKLVVLCAVSVCLAGCDSEETRGPSSNGESQDPVRVIAHEIQRIPDTQTVEAVGTARAKQAAIIYPEVSGEITAITFTSGQLVEKGQVLARIDNSVQRLEVAAAEVALKDARQLLDRYERIDVPEAISDSQIDAAQTAVEAAEIELGLAKEALEDRIIRAPFTGYVGLSEIDPGARVNDQTELTRLDDRSTLFVDFDVPEQIFGQIAEGDILPMQSFAADQGPVDARVDVIDSRIDPQQRTFTVRAVVENDEDQLRPGMSFRVTFDRPGDRLPAVPEAAIIWGGDGAYLWAIENGQTTRMPVTIAARKEGIVLVRAPLNDGDLIVSEGVQKVREGTPVNTQQRTNGSATSTNSSTGSR